MPDIPGNPTVLPGYLGDPQWNDFVALMDRHRRNFEYIHGSQRQDDASVSTRITVPNGTSVTTTIEPAEGHDFLVEEITVAPDLADLDYLIEADDVSTDHSVLPFGVPEVVRNRIRVKITNNTGSEKKMGVITDARQVRKR